MRGAEGAPGGEQASVLVLGRWEVGEEEQLEGEFGRGGHGRGREVVSSYPAANFFFLPFFPPAATLILIPLRLQGPVPPPGNPFAPGLKGSCRGETGGLRGAELEPKQIHISPFSTTLPPPPPRFQIPANRRPSISNSTRLLEGKQVSSHQHIAPLFFSPPKKKRQSSANSMNASTLRRFDAWLLLLPWHGAIRPQLKSAPPPFLSHFSTVAIDSQRSPSIEAH